MTALILKTFWLFLPAGLANMSPVLFRWVPLLDFPVDFNKKFRGKPILGSHKTYRGFLVGTIMAILTVYIQKKLYPHLAQYSLVDYSSINIYLLGFLLGFGALFGDSIKSLFKRRLDIQSGKSWVPFDQLDWIIGALALMSLYVNLPWPIILTSLIMFGFLHVTINLIGYFLQIKKNKF